MGANFSTLPVPGVSHRVVDNWIDVRVFVISFWHARWVILAFVAFMSVVLEGVLATLGPQRPNKRGRKK